jgi:hypothetical protein
MHVASSCNKDGHKVFTWGAGSAAGNYAAANGSNVVWSTHPTASGAAGQKKSGHPYTAFTGYGKTSGVSISVGPSTTRASVFAGGHTRATSNATNVPGSRTREAQTPHVRLDTTSAAFTSHHEGAGRRKAGRDEERLWQEGIHVSEGWRSIHQDGRAYVSHEEARRRGEMEERARAARLQQQREQEDRERRQREEERRRREDERRRRAKEQLRLNAKREALEKAANDRRLLDAWARYEAKPAFPLTFSSVAWPVAGPVRNTSDLSLDAIETFILSELHSHGVSPRARIQAALRRWHPDKFGPAVRGRVIERDRKAIDEGARIVAGHLNVLLRQTEGRGGGRERSR